VAANTYVYAGSYVQAVTSVSAGTSVNATTYVSAGSYVYAATTITSAGDTYAANFRVNSSSGIYYIGASTYGIYLANNLGFDHIAVYGVTYFGQSVFIGSIPPYATGTVPLAFYQTTGELCYNSSDESTKADIIDIAQSGFDTPSTSPAMRLSNEYGVSLPYATSNQNIIEKLIQLRPVKFKAAPGFAAGGDDYAAGGIYEREEIGLIAQDVEEFFPELIHESSSSPPVKSIDYSKLSIVILAALNDFINNRKWETM
jgi:hypothetical protein